MTGETIELGSHVSEDQDEGDPRFTMGLISDVMSLLKSHGYQQHVDGGRALGASVGALFNLVETYEGRR